MSYALSGYKWGTPTYGQPGGTVYWSMSLGAGLMFDETLYELSDFEAAIGDAFDVWEAVADIDFVQVASNQSPDITFDVVAIDGPSGVVGEATTFFQPLTGVDQALLGNIIFDSAETWALEPIFQTINFLTVAIHEIGHVLGLDHVNDVAQIMNPVIVTDQLGDGDIEGIQFIYGSTTETVFGTPGGETLDYSAETTPVVLYGQGGADTLRGGSADDELYGGPGNDQSFGNGGADEIADFLGNNTLDGGGGADVLVAASGQNTLLGGEGADLLIGGIGDDILTGGTGADVIVGDLPEAFLYGDDRIEGGANDDLLFGGGGADIFVFAPGEGTNTIAEIAIDYSDPAASNIIGQDFVPGLDRLDLSAFGFADAQAVFDAIQTISGSAVLSSGGTTVRVFQVTEAELGADDFILI